MRSHESATDLDQAAHTAAGPAASKRRGLSVPLRIDSPIAVVEGCQPMTIGVPFSKARVKEPYAAVVRDHEGRIVPLQVCPLARWSDGSIKWLLVDFLSPGLSAGTSEMVLRVTPGTAPSAGDRGIVVQEHRDAVVVDTGTTTFEIDRSGSCLLRRVRAGDCEVSVVPALQAILTDRKGRRRAPRIESVEVETAGPIRTTVCLTGRLDRCRGLRFRARLSFFAGTGLVRLRLAVHNPNRARHRGGLWDLGNRGSFFFRDLSLETGLVTGENNRVLWKSEPGHGWREIDHGGIEIYQDSSGGENWQSRNHVNRHGRVPCRFQGYRVRTRDEEQRGRRADPVVMLQNDAGCVTASMPEFWQQFPKALEVDRNQLRVRLFPGQWDDLFELQGGERKTHTVWLRFETDGADTSDWLQWAHQPARVNSTPEWYAASGAFPYLVPAADDPDERLHALMQRALVGEDSFFAKREAIDEYGWRNYGDVWADHEGAYYEGPKPVISHYNNQFDVIDGAITQMARTGDGRWFDVFDPLARHVMDIDIYHTERDRAAYNGGLFWFTDHYLDAATSTHRTFSRSNSPNDGRPYGGGPGSEHNFATGLLHYHYLTGDPDARRAVLGLADWVVNMDDGAKNVLGLIDDGPTGLASTYSGSAGAGPGRGAANSVNVLLDAWQLSESNAYLTKADELIRRCIHPADDLDAMDLLNAEKHWSYTMFLSALARYLNLKAERGDLDGNYAYAQQSLLHYAKWMVRHERPYLDRPEELEYPTEAWAGQEFRKANVLWLAARHADAGPAAEMRECAGDFSERAWTDLLSFDTCVFARALALVMAEGLHVTGLGLVELPSASVCAKEHDFGTPQPFVPQKLRIRDQLKTTRGVARMAYCLASPVAWRRLLSYLYDRHSD